MKRTQNDPLFPQELIFDRSGGAGDEAEVDESLGGGGVLVPEFVFPMTISAGETEEEDYESFINAVVKVPIGDEHLIWKWRKIKKNGEYGPIHEGRADIPEDASALGHFEFRMFGGDAAFPENKDVDFIRLISFSNKRDKNRNPSDHTLVPTTPPARPVGQAENTVVPNPPTVGSAKFGDYAAGTVFIRAVEAPRKEDGGIETHALIGISRNISSIKLAHHRWPKRADPVAGPYNYRGRKFTEAHLTTKAERQDNAYGDGFGTARVVLDDLRKFTNYDIVRINALARNFGDDDDGGGKESKVHLPADPANISESPHDLTPVTASGGAWLARFNTGSEISSLPNPPRFTDLVLNRPDLATERSDSMQGYRVWADDSNHTKTFAQVGATRAAVKVREPNNIALVNTFEHMLTLDEQQVLTSITIYDRSHLGKRWEWYKCVLSNASDRAQALGSYIFKAGQSSGNHLLTTVELLTPTALDNRRLRLPVRITNVRDGAQDWSVPAKLRIFESDDETGSSYHLEKPDELKGELDDAGVDIGEPGVHVKTYSVKRPAGATRLYKADVRVIGDPVRSLSNVISSASALDQSGTENTVPPGQLAIPKIKWSRKHGLRVKVTKPDKGIDGYRGDLTYEWQFAPSNAAGTNAETPVVMEEDGTIVSLGAQDPDEYPIFSAGPRHLVVIKRRDLDAGIRAGSTPLYVRVRARNNVNNLEQIGPLWSFWSAALSPAKPERDAVPAGEDDAAATPVIRHAKFGKKGLNVKCTPPAGLSHVPLKYLYQFASGAGTGTGFDPYSGSFSAGINTTYEGGQQFDTSLDLADCSSTFYDRTTGVLSLYVRAQLVDVDDDGAARLQGVPTAWYAVAAKPGHGDRGRTEEGANTMHNAVGQIEGGSCVHGNDTLFEGSAGSGDDIGKTCRVTGVSGADRINNHAAGTDAGSTGVRWDHTGAFPNGRLQWNASSLSGGSASANGVGWCWRIPKGLVASNKNYSLTFKLDSSAVVSSPAFTVDLYEQGVGAIPGTAVSIPAGTYLLGAAEQLIEILMTVGSYTSAGGKLFCRLMPSTGVSQNVFGREFMLVRGAQAMAWAPTGGEVTEEPTISYGGADMTFGGQSDDSYGGFGRDGAVTAYRRVYM